MRPIRSLRNKRGMTLVELVLTIQLGLLVMLGAGVVHRGVVNSFNQGMHKITAQREASLLSKVINRRIRLASSYMVYNVPNRTVPLTSGNGLALMDANGDVFYRFEWDSGNSTLADSTGGRVTAMKLQNLQFRNDASSPRTLFYRYQVDDDMGSMVDIESGVALRN